MAKTLGGHSATLESCRASGVRAVRTADKCNRKLLGKVKAAPRPPLARVDIASPEALVAIGISAGGPVTLHEMLPLIPVKFPPIVITQHMPADLTGPFAKRLNLESQVEVREAASGDVLKPGLALIAPGSDHLRVVRRGQGLVVKLDRGPKVSGFRPSVDVMFESVASAVGAAAVGVVMTGMGIDGAAGVRILKNKGGFTISQDEATSVVYGMPKAAAETGCVDRIAALGDIPQCISEALALMSVSMR